MNKIVLILMLFFSFETQAAAVVEKHLLNEMLTTVNRQYLNDVDNSKALTVGFQALSDLDNKFVVSRGAGRFYIYYDRKISHVVPFPDDNKDIRAWIDTVAKVIEGATKVSEKASLRDFELPDLIMKKMVESLDEYSHYYSEYEYKDDEENDALYTLYADRMIDDVLYIRIRVFNKQTGGLVKQSLEKHLNVSGVILDLRGNGGGMFNEALKVAKLFSDNKIITFTAGRNKENIHYYTSGDGVVYSGPLVVLVDGKTASAAEVLSGGLQEQKRAKLVGSHTFGKGTIQNITVMSNGGKLVLTTEQFFTPSGKVIHKNGIEPDVCLAGTVDGVCEKNDRSKIDDDIDTAINLLKEDI